MALSDKFVDADLEVMVPVVLEALKDKAFRHAYRARLALNDSTLERMRRKAGRVWNEHQRISNTG